VNKHLQLAAAAVSGRAPAMSAEPICWLNSSLVFPYLHWNWQEKRIFVSAHLQPSIVLQ
jgi:hypothetical protein